VNFESAAFIYGLQKDKAPAPGSDASAV